MCNQGICMMKFSLPFGSLLDSEDLVELCKNNYTIFDTAQTNSYVCFPAPILSSTAAKT